MQRESKLQYLELKGKLTALNYTEPFKEDACDLVGRLVTDLISTTNSYKVLQEKEARIASDLALSQAQLFPLRKENARLARENHDLHNDTIRLNDEIKSSSDDYLRQLQRAQEQLQDSQFLCESLQEQLKQKTDSIDRLRTAYDAVADPSLKAPGNIGGNANRAIKMSTKLSGRGGQVAELEVLHQSNKIEGAAGTLVAEKDTIIRTLRTQLEAANTAFVSRDEECRRLSSAVAAREQEIARSSKLINSGAASRAGASDASSGLQLSGNMADQYVAADTANKRIIDQLNGQVDFLNNELAKREAQLVDVNDKLLQYDALRAELMHRNALLDQARKDASQASSRVRALEQKVLTYQNAQTESAAAAELAQHAASSSPSPESKQQEGAAREADLKMLLGKASAERDELREEVARLRRIATTLSLPSSTAAPASNIPLRTASAGKRSGAIGTARNAASKGPTPSLKATEKDEQLAKTNVLVIELNEEIEALKKKLHVTERAVAQRQEQVAVLEKERDEWQRRVQASEERRDRSTLQQLHTELQEQYTLCQQQLAESNRERSQLRGLSEAATEDLATLRTQLQEERLAREEAETRLVFESKDLELSRQTARKQSDDLSHLATETARLRMDCEDLREEVAREKMRSDSARKMAAEAQALMDKRSAELADVNHQLALLRTGASDAAGSGETEDQLRKDHHRLQIKLQELESQQLGWQRETRALQRIAQSLGVMAQQERAARGQVEEQEVASVLDAVARKDRELVQSQRDLVDLKAALQREQAETSALQDEVGRLKLEVRGLLDQCAEEQHVASQLRSDLELTQQRLVKLRGDQEDALQRQMDAQHMRAGSEQHLLTLRSELKEKSDALAHTQRALEAVEEHRDVLKRQLDDATTRSRADKAELQQAVGDRQQLQVRCEELQILVGNLETSLRAHSHKHTRLTAEVERGGEDQQLWEQERVRLQSTLAARDNRVREQQEALQSLDRERDRLQEHLDAAEERMQQLQAAQTQVEMKFSAQVKVQEQTERKLQAITAELTSAQRHAHAADARVQAAQLEITELKRRLSQKSVEVGGASKDLMAMTRENQALTSELVQVSRERDQLQQRLQQVLHQSAGNEHARRAAEVERTDLLNTYRAVLQEKRRLEEDVASLSTIKEREGQSAQQLQDKLAHLQGTMAAQSATETRWKGERAALLSQLDALNDHLVRTQHKLEAAEAENRKMMQDTSGLKQNNVMLNERINMIIKRAGAATEANKLLTGRLGTVERERDAVRALVGIERQRAADMGHLAESARAESASKELHLQRLRAAASTPGTSGAAAATAGSVGTTFTSSSQYYAFRSTQQQAGDGATGSHSSSRSPSRSPAASPVQEPLQRSGAGGDLRQGVSTAFLAAPADTAATAAET